MLWKKIRKGLSAGRVQSVTTKIVMNRDEEKNMTGIHNLDFSELEAKHVLVLDGDRLGVLEVSGASYTNARLIVTTPYGGHSGIDIHERHRLNAAKLVAELIMNIPQGVFYKDETGTITSINIGTVIAGNIEGNAGKIVQDQIKCNKYIDYFMENAITNIINIVLIAVGIVLVFLGIAIIIKLK